MIVVVMVAHVVFLQPQPDAPLHRKMMGGVMHRVVKQIADEKPGESSGRDPAEDDEEQPAKEQSERNADDGRHDEAAGVFRIIVMDAV